MNEWTNVPVDKIKTYCLPAKHCLYFFIKHLFVLDYPFIWTQECRRNTRSSSKNKLKLNLTQKSKADAADKPYEQT